MLPAPYFHVIITVPEELRATLRSNQRDGYGALIKAAAEAIIELARDRRFVGGTVGVLAVLHTWTQQLLYHPHVHCLVTGGGVSPDRRSWYPARRGFLVPPKALAKLIRGKLRDRLRRHRPDLVLPSAPGANPGSSTSRLGARASKPCSTTSPVTSSASPSPTPASSTSATTP